MSNRSRLLVLALTLAGSPAAAQHLARLERMWKDAALASARVDSLARLRAREALDTSRAGNVIVLAPAGLMSAARDAATTAWEGLYRTFGDEILPARHKPLVTALYQADKGPPPYGFPTDAAPIPVATGRGAHLLLPQMLFTLTDRLRKDFDRPFEHWLRGAIRTEPLDHVSPLLFEDLVTSPSPLARACYVGSLDACGSALGLVAPRDPATEWYDAPGRRELVRNLVIPRSGGVWYGQCVEYGVDEACIRVLHGPDSMSVEPPLIFPNRELVVRMALQLGGPEAFHRLLGSAGRPVGQRLELAAGMSLDSLLTRWRQAVLLARPESVDVSAGIGWVALAWALVLSAFVLGSSRWRL